MRDGIPFGHFLLVKKLAAGGMGEVFLARAREPGPWPELLAVKRLRPELGQDPEFSGTFLDEARIIAHLSHPNVVRIFEVGLVEGALFIAMELVEGVSLDRIIEAARRQSTSLPWPLAATVVADLCRAL